MIKRFLNKYGVVIFLALLTFLVFWQFFIKGLYAYPGNFMLAWFEPWKSDNFVNGVITIPHKPVASDIFRQIYPFKILAIDMFKSGQFPLWNPFNGAGMPLLATLNMGLLDPFNLLYFVMSYPNAWMTSMVAQFFMVGSLMYVYLRKISLSKNASVVGSLLFLFSGAVFVRFIYNIFGLAFSMLPFMLYIFEDYIKNKNTKLIYLIPIVTFLTIVSTQPQISLYIISFWIIYLTYRLYQTTKLRDAIYPIILLFLGFGISSIQLLPTLELFKHANLNPESSKFIFDGFLLPLNHLISIIIPNYFGSDSTYNFWGKGDYIETIANIGSTGVFLALIGLIFKPKNKTPDLRRFLLIVVLVTFATSLNWIFPKLLFSLPIPLISTGIPSRIFIISTFALCVLAGIGTDSLIANLKTKKVKYAVAIFSLLFITIIAGTFIVYAIKLPCPPPGIIENCRNISFRNSLLEFISFVVIIGGIIFAIYIKRIQKLIPYLIIGVIVLFGFYNASKFLPFSPSQTFKPDNELINKVTSLGRDGRVFGIGEANIGTDFATLFNFYDPDYYHPLYIKRYGELINYANTGNATKALPRSDINILKDATLSANLSQRRERLLNLLSVKYLVYKKNEIPNVNNVIWENDKWQITSNPSLNRAYVVNKFTIQENSNKVLEDLFDDNFDPNTDVILGTKPSKSLNGTTGTAKILKDDGNEIEIETNSNGNSLLILTDNYYPGWKAFNMGKETKILQANYNMRAIPIPKGESVIKIAYRPDSFKFGVYISLISTFIFISLCVRRGLKH